MPNSLPLNWCECKLVDTCDVYQPKTISTKELIKDGKYTVYGANGIIGRYNQYNHENSEILITCRGVTCGTINKSKPFSWINGNAMVVHPFIKISSDFLFYYLNSVNFKPYISGSAQPQITRISLQPLSLPLPPFAEQKRIVGKIEELFAKIDNGIENLKTAQAQIKQYRQSVLKSAFDQCKHRGTINDIAQLIKIGPFGSLLHKSDYVKNAIPLVNPSHIKNLTILPNKDICVLPSKLKQLQSYVLKKYDIVIGRRGEMGRCAVVEEQQEGWLCGTGSMFLRLKKENYPYFYALYIASQQCIQHLERNAMGTTMKNLNEKIIKKVPIPLPSLSEQKRIVAKIEKRFAVADELEKAVSDGLEKANQLKQSILKKAFSGQLVPQDPNDEPASVLLERIKKDKQSQTKGKKK
ncbi:MAG: restriction endonuclease subunit S [Alphaproteobacteria bacterium]|nr:restriction endonuclease subunit S [Alphaproteobacteria bacterium]MBQ9235309.1 restriction endonuclease subunit S [Alphaproteobacteria bacterium]